MDAHKIDVLRKLIGHWKIDIEKGLIFTPRGSNGNIDKKGRLRTSVSYEGKMYLFYVHQVIAFAGGLDLLDKDVNHKDGNKLNNKIENLETISRQDNLVHQRENLLVGDSYGSKHHNTRLTEEDVLEIRRLHSAGFTQTKLSEMFNLDISGINRIVKRVNWKHI